MSDPGFGWRRHWPWVAIPALLLLFTANHLEYWRRSQARSTDRGEVSVRLELNLLSGHNSIGIEERDSGGSALLHFALLGQWNYSRKQPSPCPSAIRSLHGKTVSCLGFMYPLEAGKKIRNFCLMRTTQTCCYGPRPQYNQYLLVEMDKPVRFERLTPVVVSGRFVVDPQPDQGFIYRLEGRALQSAADEEPEDNPATLGAARLPLFDFSLLAAVAASPDRRLPPALSALNRRQLLVAGYFCHREADRFLVGANFWDGVNPATAPSYFNSVMVFPRSPTSIPPLWQEKGVMKGVLRIETDRTRWSRYGMVSLRQAEALKRGRLRIRLNPGPYLGIWEELLLLAAVLYWSLRKRRRPEASTTTE